MVLLILYSKEGKHRVGGDTSIPLPHKFACIFVVYKILNLLKLTFRFSKSQKLKSYDLMASRDQRLERLYAFKSKDLSSLRTYDIEGTLTSLT